MRTLIINSTNVVPNGLNNQFLYQFPTGSVKFDHDQIAVAAISLFFSWYNISSGTTNSKYNNNAYDYLWWDGSVHQVLMPDGHYEISTINAYLQDVMVTNGHYLVNAKGEYVYYLEWVVNVSRYAVQLNCYLIPSSLPSGYTNPAGMTFPPSPQTAQVQILGFVPSRAPVLNESNFGQVVGFFPGLYPPSIKTQNFSHISDFTPEVDNVSSITMKCSLLNNRYSLPSTLLYTFSTSGTNFGSNFNFAAPQFAFVDIEDGSYTNFTIEFVDQNLRPIYFNDTQLSILLVVGRKEAYLTK
jgi:hypothetical protein